MKLINYITTSLLLVSMGFIGSCDKNEEGTLSKAVLASASTLNFEVNGASEKIITVYADADWLTEVPDWVTVTPASGSGMMDVTISVTDNMREGAPDNPRKAAIVFKGSTLASRAEVLVTQDGDKYRDCQDYTLEQLETLANETVVSVPDVMVAAVTSTGFIVSQNDANIYMLSSATVAVGDVVSVKGEKLSDSAQLVYVECDEVTVSHTGSTITYPQPTDITTLIDTYTSASRSYVTVSGILNGTNIKVEGAQYSVAIIDAPESWNLASMDGHRVTVCGYFAGVAAPIVKLTLARLNDNGIVEIIYFTEDFEWLAPHADASNAGSTVETDNLSATI